MAVSFRLRTQKTVGKAPLYERVQDVNLKVNLMLSTRLEVDIETWNKPHRGRAFKAYINSSEGRRVCELSEEIKHTIESLLGQGISITSAMTEKLTETVEIEETKGGTPKMVKYKKWELIHTHTARRTGAALMYLSGMDIYDIMKITGHSSPAMLKKYIKADQLEVVDKIMNKYDYFK